MAIAIVVVGSFVPSILLSGAQAAGGDLDLTFGSAGKVITQFYASSFNEAHAIALQSDGKIVAGGTVWQGFDTYDFAVARYYPDGTLDSSFGAGGKVTTDFGGSSDVIRGIAVQQDQGIVAVGSALFGRSDFAVARYKGNGTLDLSFGIGGKVKTDFFGSEDFAKAVVIQPDGKTVVAGDAAVPGTGFDFAAVRYHSNGSLDSSFGIGGKVTIDFRGFDNRASAVVLQSDGKIVVGGEGAGFGAVRLNSDGSLDPKFGTGGKVSTGFFEGPLDALSLAIQTDGKIVQGGWATIPNTTQFFMALLRYKPDGSLDPSFGTGGKVLIDFGSDGGAAESLAIQSDGKIVVGGTANTPDTGAFSVVRLNMNGSLDGSFGSGGRVLTTFGGGDLGHSVLLQPDRKIVLGGRAGASFGLARYSGDGNFDICLQDDSNGNRLQFNSTTGEYVFTNCGGFSAGGSGGLTQRGNIITLQHNGLDRRLLARIDGGVNKGNASLQMLPLGVTFTISDRNTLNNACSCGASVGIVVR